MELQKILNLLNKANDYNICDKKNATLSTIIQRQIMMQQMKLPIIQKF